jgi:Flp pilus assembly protein TadB
LALLGGALVIGGLCALVLAFVPRAPRLSDALAVLTDDPEVSAARARVQRDDLGLSGSRSDRLGGWLYRVTPIPLTERQLQDLKVKDKGVAEFFADKFVLALIGLATPTLLVVLVGWSLGSLPVAVPVLVALAGLVLGYFVPDLQLRGSATHRRQDAGHALLTYIDLVTLERLANASATQALHNAAGVSEVPLFVRIRRSLERAQLEQQSPYAELRRLADQLKLPELGDLVDVMQLDEAGASLAGALRARVRELRNAHLAKEQQEADAVSESMTVFMAVPALIFGLFFMVPPLLRIVGG